VPDRLAHNRHRLHVRDDQKLTGRIYINTLAKELSCKINAR
jgi:hypothetical protein